MYVKLVVLSGGHYHCCHILQVNELLHKGHPTSPHACCVGRKVQKTMTGGVIKVKWNC